MASRQKPTIVNEGTEAVSRFNGTMVQRKTSPSAKPSIRKLNAASHGANLSQAKSRGLMKSQRWLLPLVVLVGMATLSAQTPRPTFEVASVRKTVQPNPIAPAPTAPDTFYRAGEILPYFIRLAYSIQSFQLAGGPEWVRTDRFEIHAKSDAPASPGQLRRMLQTLLAERFKLVLRKEQQDMPHLALVVDRKNLGPNLTPCADWLNPPPFNASPKMPQGASFFRNRCVELSEVATRATAAMGTPAIDKTGLTGLWNYTIVYRRPRPVDASPAADADAPFFDVAMRQQLGLKLESARGPVDVLVIDSVQQPTEN